MPTTSRQNTIEALQTINSKVEKVKNLDLDIDLNLLSNNDTLHTKLQIDSPPMSPLSQTSGGKQDRKLTESRHSLMLNIPKPPVL